MSIILRLFQLRHSLASAAGSSSCRSIGSAITCWILAALLVASPVYAAPPISFGDSFEGLKLYPFWSALQQSGSVSLSTDRAYSGSHSLKFASASGNNRNIAVKHVFGTPTKGTVSVAFYDYAPGQQTLYEQLSLSLSTNSAVYASVGTMDFDSQCYEATFGTNGGPNAVCGAYPQMSTTPIVRSAGWHILSIAFGQATASISIDGVVVYSASGNLQFDTIQLAVSGPSWRPDTVAYFD